MAGISLALDPRAVACRRLARRSPTDHFVSPAHPFAPFLRPAYTCSSDLSPVIGLQTLRAEFRPTLRLAIPLVLAEIGWMSMAIVDTMMVGHLPNSATAMGAVSLGSNIFIVLALFGAGLLMGLDTLVSQAFGAGRREDCHRSLLNSIYLSVALAPFLAAPVWLLPTLLAGMQVDPGVLALAIPYTKALTARLLPLLLYFAVRRCLQAMNMVKPVAFALVTANIVNALCNWILVFGKC